MDLHTAGHSRGVASAPHRLAAEAGREILAEGGNALEAMIAMAATIAAVYPHMNHVGGDGFWLVREPNGRVRAIMAAGPAGAKATQKFYRDHQYDEIPARGPLAALTVPAAVGGWIQALDGAKSLGGRLPLDMLLNAAIKHAREGFAVTRSQEQLSAEKFDELKDAPGFAAQFLPDGKAPKAGDMMKQATLAATLDQLANAGLDDFYRGDVGHEIAADLERIGSPVTRADLEGYAAKIADPLSVKISAGTLYNTPLPTQGLASLMILALYDRLNVKEPEGFAHIHGLVEATKRAFIVRNRIVTDPAFPPEPPASFLEAKFLDADVRNIDAKRAAPWPHPPKKGDTIWMGAADKSGLVVSYIQSIFWEFGSGCVLPKTGVLMQNRGASFSLDPNALNALAPGRLPFHTLNPALAVLRDGRVMAYGTMGGEGQPQSQAAFFTRHVLHGQPMDVALDKPRWLLGRTWGSSHTNLRMENRFDGHLIDRMMSAGHDIDVVGEGYSDTMGHAGAVTLHPSGEIEGGHDPRADGGAAGV
jgi:gamma-glutamyltranspeptidase/glutathione hydrolase